MTDEPDRLFDVPPLVEIPTEPISAGRRLTIRNAELLAAGIHPATRRPLLETQTPSTCGDCAHHVAHGHGNRTWHKCERHRLGTSSSANSDIRVGWPACALYEPAPLEET